MKGVLKMSKKKIKTKKEIEDKLEFYERGLAEINERLGRVV